MVLFITEQGAKIVKEGRVLMVYKDQQRIFMYPMENLTQLIIMGRVELSTAMLGALMGMGIDTVFLSRDGRFKGKLIGERSKNIFIRERQFERRGDPEVCLNFSRKIIESKIRNARFCLRQSNSAVYEAIKPRLDNALKTLQRTGTLHSLRGVEGAFAALYFEFFPRLLKNPLGFKKRIKHPPPDPVNILLSLGYTLLFSNIYALVEAAGLDPYAGFYHQSSYGHPALVSDLMEPYRAAIVDRLVIRLLNQGKVDQNSFVKEKDRLRLNKETLGEFVSEYQRRLFTRFAADGQQKNLWGILQQDVWNFQKYLEGKIERYQPHIFR